MAESTSSGGPADYSLSGGVGAGGGAVGGGGISGGTGSLGATGATYGDTPGSGGAAQGAKDQVQEKAGQAKEQVQEKAGQAAQQAKGLVRGQVDQRSTQAGELVTSQASDIRTVGQQLREQGKEGPAKVADQVAGRIEGVGNYLTNSDGDRILSDIENFARRSPWAVILGGLSLGFAASRVLKASSSDRYHGTSSRGGSYGGGSSYDSLRYPPATTTTVEPAYGTTEPTYGATYTAPTTGQSIGGGVRADEDYVPPAGGTAYGGAA